MLSSGKCLHNHDSIARHGSARPESTIRSGSGFPGTPRFPTAVPSVVHRSGKILPSVVRGAPYPRLLPAENTTKNHTTSLNSSSVSRTRSGKRFNKLDANEKLEVLSGKTVKIDVNCYGRGLEKYVLEENFLSDFQNNTSINHNQSSNPDVPFSKELELGTSSDCPSLCSIPNLESGQDLSDQVESKKLNLDKNIEKNRRITLRRRVVSKSDNSKRNLSNRVSPKDLSLVENLAPISSKRKDFSRNLSNQGSSKNSNFDVEMKPKRITLRCTSNPTKRMDSGKKSSNRGQSKDTTIQEGLNLTLSNEDNSRRNLRNQISSKDLNLLDKPKRITLRDLESSSTIRPLNSSARKNSGKILSNQSRSRNSTLIDKFNTQQITLFDVKESSSEAFLTISPKEKRYTPNFNKDIKQITLCKNEPKVQNPIIKCGVFSLSEKSTQITLCKNNESKTITIEQDQEIVPSISQKQTVTTVAKNAITLASNALSLTEKPTQITLCKNKKSKTITLVSDCETEPTISQQKLLPQLLKMLLP